MQDIARFRDFWPYYLQEHARAGTRALHYAGTSLVLLILIAMPIVGDWWIALALPLIGYGFAWVGHGFIERNRPATLRFPLWSLRADFVMWYRFMTGHIPHDLSRAGVRADGTVDPDRRIRL